MMRLKNLAGVFTGEAFEKSDGRKPREVSFLKGPLDLVFEKGRIARIEKTSSSAGDFDGSSLTATAGWVDSHTHALFSGHRAGEFFLRWQGASYREISDAGGGIHNSVSQTLAALKSEAFAQDFARRLQALLASGTTTLEIKSGYGQTPEAELESLRFLKQARGPRILSTFLGLHALPPDQNEKAFVEGMIKILPTIAQENLAHFADAFPEEGFFSLAESVRFLDAAQKLGLKLKVHADEITDMKAAATFARRGALSVDHLQKINDEGVRALSEGSTVATLLPATSFYLGLPYAPARRLLDAGARVALATDYNPGTAPAPHFHFTQLLAASQYRMSPAEILCASTYNAAASLGLENEVGTLLPGRSADVLLWKASSLEEILLGGDKPAAVFSQGLKVNLRPILVA